MAVSINDVQLSLPQTVIAGGFLVLGFLYMAFQMTELIRMLLSTFVTSGKPVRPSILRVQESSLTHS
jgi:hypothetical protein